MSADLRLAQAIGTLVQRRLAAGLGYLRVPEMVSPFPVVELLEELHDLSDTRYAVFLDAAPVEESALITLHVFEAIRWRNDAEIADNILIIGDLERDRAAGLASIPTITANDVRQELLDQLIGEAQSRSAMTKTVQLLQALKSERVSIDLQYLADYCDNLAPSLGTSDLEEAVSSLWRMKLLPDRASVDIDARRLRENAQRVNELRQTDATSIQQLIRQLSAHESGNYEALRLFASTGKREYLQTLRLDAVRDALRSARAEAEGNADEGEGRGRTEQMQFLELRAGRED